MGRIGTVGLCLFACLVWAGSVFASSGISVRLHVASASYQTLRETPVMVSVIGDGELVAQEEISSGGSGNFILSPGLYDVRLEGEGMQTLVKRGIQVVQDKWTKVQGGPCEAGEGVRIVEYAHTGLSREEVAARLAALEEQVATLKVALKELEKRDE